MKVTRLSATSRFVRVQSHRAGSSGPMHASMNRRRSFFRQYTSVNARRKLTSAAGSTAFTRAPSSTRSRQTPGQQTTAMICSLGPQISNRASELQKPRPEVYRDVDEAVGLVLGQSE